MVTADPLACSSRSAAVSSAVLPAPGWPPRTTAVGFATQVEAGSSEGSTSCWKMRSCCSSVSAQRSLSPGSAISCCEQRAVVLQCRP